MKPRPFVIDVTQEKLDRIDARLALSTPGYAPADDGDWQYGTDAGWLASLLDYWRNEYDWRRGERRLNAFSNYQVEIDGIAIHFIRAGGEDGSDRPPILLTHGWPGSVLEFLDVIEPLNAMGFDVVVPALPGFGFSERPSTIIGPRKVADMWRRLMTQALGYDRFFAQGGDWGSVVTAALGRDHPDVVAAIHLNLFVGLQDTADDDIEMAEYRARLAAVQAAESAYMMEQATKPQTIGLALADSPIGFAAWVCEKFHGWADINGTIESRFSKDWLLDNIMTYLVNDTVQSSIWMYRSIFTEPRLESRVEVPTGLALYPAEFMPYPPRSAAQRTYNVRDWQIMPAGGHFAAKEEPAAFARNVGQFFQSM